VERGRPSTGSGERGLVEKIETEIMALMQRYNPEGKPIDRSTEIGADLNIDSVAAMDLIMEIEDKFDIDIPMSQVGELKTIGDLIDLAAGQLTKA
jgi:acyl carrier protein